MKKIQINTSTAYNVIIDKGILKNCGQLAKEVVGPCTVAIITDDTVNSLYGTVVENSFKHEGFNCVKYVFPHGEESKSAGEFVKILEFLAENHLTRTDIIVALGGGVTGDLAGYSAASYLRGIRFIQIPTTLLAAVDSSVGGKTAINLNAGKNLAGAFHQPSLVICDTDSFDTLSEEIFADGMAESLKYGVIADEDLFERMQTDVKENICHIVARCIEIKGNIVAHDEFDHGERQLLNFGHTVGHAIEKCSSFEISHGHAVAAGMVIASRGAEKEGIAKPGTTERIISALEKFGLPTKCAFSADELTSIALSDKKRAGGEITLVLPEKIGKCVLKKMPVESLGKFIAEGLFL
ncbi:MAG: 3-dehydroquinate synthase [Bacillota bacterium]|nr:3-dehydroquinate synthase [Bacillota bacterium]